MKTMVLAALAVLALDVGAASAQGYAGATEPVYGSKWAERVASEKADSAAALASAPKNTRTGSVNKEMRGGPAPLASRGS